jgi:protein-tyrosine phosphatase
MADPSRGFGPAAPGEETVFGARRPGYPDQPVPQAEVGRWISFMKDRGIGRVVCLLSREQVESYQDMPGSYEKAFGADNVLWAPIEDYHLADLHELAGRILPFLSSSREQGMKVVVHCAGGIGRTGQVLAAWLVGFRGMGNEEALETVRKGGRNAGESGDPGLSDLLDACREAFRNGGSGTKEPEGDEHV